VRRNAHRLASLGVVATLALAPADALARGGCTETSESGAVGYSHCLRSGGWNSVRRSVLGAISFGVNEHHLDLGGRYRFYGACTAAGCDAQAYAGFSESGWSGLRANVTTGMVRLTAVQWSVLHLGMQAEWGPGGTSDRLHVPGVVGGVTSIAYTAWGLFFGARTGFGHFVLGGDVLAGHTDIDIDTSWLKMRGLGHADSGLESLSRYVLQGDVSLVYYVTPRIALGVRAGADAVHPTEDLFGGLLVRFSYEPYEGTR